MEAANPVSAEHEAMLGISKFTCGYIENPTNKPIPHNHLLPTWFAFTNHIMMGKSAAHSECSLHSTVIWASTGMQIGTSFKDIHHKAHSLIHIYAHDPSTERGYSPMQRDLASAGGTRASRENQKCLHGASPGIRGMMPLTIQHRAF